LKLYSTDVINYIVNYNRFSNITNLYFNFYFDKNIDALQNSFPNLNNLTFSSRFNKNIDALQNSFPNLKNFTIKIYNLVTYKYKCTKYGSIVEYINILYNIIL